MRQPAEDRLADFFLPVMEYARHSLDEPAGHDAATLGAELMNRLEAACARALERGCAQEDVDQALFAVVAWLDEMAMAHAWEGARAWRLTPLQRHYFSTTRAGSEFYERLQALPEEDVAVREVYALALVAGFRGEFRTRPASAFQACIQPLIQGIQTLDKHPGLGTGMPVFPGALPGRYLQGQGQFHRRRPTLSLLLIVGLPLAVIAAVYLYLDFSLGQLAASLIRRA